jgi:hypothetical protein
MVTLKVPLMSRLTDFVSMVLRDRLDISPAEFARRMKIDRSSVHQALNASPQSNSSSTHKIPLKKAGIWAKHLRLSPSETLWFLTEVAVEHSPIEAQRLVQRLRDQSLALAKQVSRLRDELRRAGGSMPDESAPFADQSLLDGSALPGDRVEPLRSDELDEGAPGGTG